MITLEILKQFSSTDETGLTILKPWSKGAFTYSTDGRVLIRVPRIEGAPELEQPARTAKQIEGYFKSESNYMDFEPMPSMPEGGWGEQCPVCNGAGKSDQVRRDCCDTITTINTVIPCDECDATGRKTFLCRFQFGRHLLNQFYLAKLSTLPNVRLAQNKNSDLGELAIRFDGGDGRLMPMKPENT